MASLKALSPLAIWNLYFTVVPLVSPVFLSMLRRDGNFRMTRTRSASSLSMAIVTSCILFSWMLTDFGVSTKSNPDIGVWSCEPSRKSQVIPLKFGDPSSFRIGRSSTKIDFAPSTSPPMTPSPSRSRMDAIAREFTVSSASTGVRLEPLLFLPPAPAIRRGSLFFLNCSMFKNFPSY
ncbi:Uncharacterised protein [Enterobacter hormaechei]|nr:Uncharacterised protein [Enterobacter hormaechei]